MKITPDDKVYLENQTWAIKNKIKQRGARNFISSMIELLEQTRYQLLEARESQELFYRFLDLYYPKNEQKIAMEIYCREKLNDPLLDSTAVIIGAKKLLVDLRKELNPYYQPNEGKREVK
jgi:hypothetical protein